MTLEIGGRMAAWETEKENIDAPPKGDYCTVAVECGASPGAPALTSVSENLKGIASVQVRDSLDQWLD